MRPITETDRLQGLDQTRPASATDSRSLGALVKDLRDEATALIRQEVALAKVELTEKASVMGKGAGSIAAGGMLVFAGLLFLLAALTSGLVVLMFMAGLDESVASWLAPLIVGLLAAGIGAALALAGWKKIKKESAVPKETVASLQENKQWLKHKMA